MSSQDNSPSWGLQWRSNSTFIIATVAAGLFTDLFLYGLVVPVLPFMLQDRIDIPQDQIQSYVSALLAVYAGSSCLFSVPAGWIADRTKSRQMPFLLGLAALLGATILLGFGQNIPVLVIARSLQGISAAIVWTVGLAMVLDTIGPKHLGKVVGTIFSFISVGELLAPVLGGALYEKTGYAGVFGLGAGLLGIDFFMRLLLIEKKTAAKYYDSARNGAVNSRQQESRDEYDHDDEEANEEDELLPKSKEREYKIPGGQNKIIRTLPILYCLSNPRLLMALVLAFTHATLLATFDATVPTEAQDLFDFSSLDSGLLFIALDIPYLALGTIAGWAVDKYGAKPVTVLGYGYLVPALVLLRLPAEQILQGKGNIILYCAVLALNGVGLAIIGSPSVVEASNVVQKYDKANPDFFGENGPYAQLYGFNSLMFCAGLSIGPILSGGLKDRIGYGNMNVVVAVLSGITAMLSFFIIGGKPKLLTKENR